MYPLQTSLSASVDKIDSTRRKAKGQKNPENYSSAHTKQSSPNRTLSEKSVKKKRTRQTFFTLWALSRCELTGFLFTVINIVVVI